ncbi:hypothetical protein SAMN03080615_01619 [Amphritea atlantica]|uniref:Uncharacterized protein n=1 Tax=Amphritea atlantica TaxID=355243 RepID=A0A1H9GD86_9GAMM|nr:hypothetical protein [Amphritea atlantica]SEQ48105.1 hypothetical protein SAMN03080615_01619 [Amphritea atlantica]
MNTLLIGIVIILAAFYAIIIMPRQHGRSWAKASVVIALIIGSGAVIAGASMMLFGAVS